ncbi:MAG: L-threonylcarbamoyladenylate synthase [Balneolaceae bacterium]
MAERVKLHPDIPHQKRIFTIADRLREGALLLFPTDSQYALGCDYQNKKGIDRIRQIRGFNMDDHLSVMCHGLQHVSKFARLEDANFKLMRRLIPSPFTFILPATREVPKLLVHPKKKTVGIRVPDYPICLRMIEELKRPLLAITAKLEGVEFDGVTDEGREMFLSRFQNRVDLIIDNQQPLSQKESSVIDLTGEAPEVLREGLGMERFREALSMEGIAV